MDNLQKAGIIVIPAIGIIVTVIIVGSFWIYSSQNGRCIQWSDDLEMKRAELEGRQDSLGGAIDLDGSVGVFRNQFNLEVDRYNTECAY